MEMDAAQWANVAASGLVAVCAGVFVVTYHRLAPWRSSATGRHLMMFSAAIGALALYTVLIAFVPVMGVVATVLRVTRVLLLLAVAGLLVQRTRMVREAQRAESPGRTGVPRQ